MAFDEYQADRIRQVFKSKNIHFEEKKMMGGLCFMVDNKMCVGTHTDKKLGVDLLMARIGEEAVKQSLSKKGCLPMDFTGRVMKNYVFIDPNGTDTDAELEEWLELAIAFNPLAKASKSKKKKAKS